MQSLICSHCVLLSQIRKCTDTTCCSPPITSDQQRQWIPDPVMEENGEHYKPLSEVIGTETTDSDRPGIIPRQKSKMANSKRQAPAPEMDYFLADEMVSLSLYMLVMFTG